MSEDESYTHYAVRVPNSLLRLLDDLCYIKVGSENIKIHDRSDIAREALLKGVKLMLMEKVILKRLMSMDANKSAKQVYTHLEKTADTEQVAVDNEKGVPA